MDLETIPLRGIVALAPIAIVWAPWGPILPRDRCVARSRGRSPFRSSRSWPSMRATSRSSRGGGSRDRSCRGPVLPALGEPCGERPVGPLVLPARPRLRENELRPRSLDLSSLASGRKGGSPACTRVVPAGLSSPFFASWRRKRVWRMQDLRPTVEPGGRTQRAIDPGGSRRTRPWVMPTGDWLPRN